MLCIYNQSSPSSPPPSNITTISILPNSQAIFCFFKSNMGIPDTPLIHADRPGLFTIPIHFARSHIPALDCCSNICSIFFKSSTTCLFPSAQDIWSTPREFQIPLEESAVLPAARGMMTSSSCTRSMILLFVSPRMKSASWMPKHLSQFTATERRPRK